MPTKKVASDSEEVGSEAESEDNKHKELMNVNCKFISWTGPGKRVPILIFKAENMFVKNKELKMVGEKYHLSYKMVRTESKLVRSILASHGFHEVHPNSNDFNLMWTGSHLKPFSLRCMHEFQKINHFPRSYELTRKDRLYKNIQRMQQSKGVKNFDFIPGSFILPSEYQEFCTAFLRDKGPWIVKPIASSRGRGIYLVNHPQQVPVDENILVSRYIHNPLTIDGFKFDIRIYVAVTCYDPLLIYLYEEGLTRFATVKYEKSNRTLKNQMMHLTNYSVNKKSSDYVRCDDPDVEDYGNKWTMSAMLRYLKQEGLDTTALMVRIEDVVVKTILSAEMHIATACKMFMPYRGNCFEVYGFDILVDENLKPWLLEVNLSPSLACDAPLDLKVKSHMIADLFALTGFMCHDPMVRKIQQSKRNQDIAAKTAQRAQSARERPDFSVGRQRPQSAGSVNVRQLRDRPQSGPGSWAKVEGSSLSREEQKVLVRVKEEFGRKGGFIRLFPAPDSWEHYGAFLEYKTTMNKMLVDKLFPNRARGYRGGRSTSASYSSATAKSGTMAQASIEPEMTLRSRAKQYERKKYTADARKRQRKIKETKRNRNTPNGSIKGRLAQGQYDTESSEEEEESEEESDEELTADDSDVDSATSATDHKAGDRTKKVSTAAASASKSRAVQASASSTSEGNVQASAAANKLSGKPPIAASASTKTLGTSATECSEASSHQATTKSGATVTVSKSGPSSGSGRARTSADGHSATEASDTGNESNADSAHSGHGEQGRGVGNAAGTGKPSSERDAYVGSAGGTKEERQGPISRTASVYPPEVPRHFHDVPATSQQPKVINLVKILEDGGNLSKVQARSAFAMYLQRVQQRLLQESHNKDDKGEPRHDEQMDLVLRFLKRAAGNLQQPFKVVVPSRKLPLHDRRRILAKQLGDFVHIYSRETDLLSQRTELDKKYGQTSQAKDGPESTVTKEDFRAFIGIASEGELEEVLTTYTKLNKSASIFLGSNAKTVNPGYKFYPPPPSPGAGETALGRRKEDSNQLAQGVPTTEYPVTIHIPHGAAHPSTGPHSASSQSSLTSGSSSASHGPTAQPTQQAPPNRDAYPGNYFRPQVQPGTTTGTEGVQPNVTTTTGYARKSMGPSGMTGQHQRSASAGRYTGPMSGVDIPTSSLSSLQAAAYIYSTKLTGTVKNRPSSASKAVLTEAEKAAQRHTLLFKSSKPPYGRRKGRPPSAGRGGSGSRPGSAGRPGSATRTRPMSAVTYRDKPDGQTAPQNYREQSEQAINEALQRLAERQAARQYSAPSAHHILAQQLANINLAASKHIAAMKSAAAAKKPRARTASWAGSVPTSTGIAEGIYANVQEAESGKTRTASELRGGDATFNSFVEDVGQGPAGWDQGYGTGIPTSSYQLQYGSHQTGGVTDDRDRQHQQLKQQSQELLQESKAKHQAMIAAAHTAAQQRAKQHHDGDSAAKMVPKPPPQPAGTRKPVSTQRMARTMMLDDPGNFYSSVKYDTATGVTKSAYASGT
ncbi:PREDICTED: tubulin polyglutamylase TTLL5-like [Branchiostoma belcheri]|uniref:Tubulin--tyrosine ligase-like protein 5 n=1 Tax=Branchiostoma belcheri TaxID=7741 RepID=A0A6P4YSE0_BRABE|nr:PREDICTED: tubulin polyglutamylase TTLL5-like [Branchiostoma belcheri]